MNKKFAIDAGTHSIGLAVLTSDPEPLVMELKTIRIADRIKAHNEYKIRRRAKITRTNAVVREKRLMAEFAIAELQSSAANTDAIHNGRKSIFANTNFQSKGGPRTRRAKEVRPPAVSSGNMLEYTARACSEAIVDINDIVVVMAALLKKRGFYEGESAAARTSRHLTQELEQKLDQYDMSAAEFRFLRPDIEDQTSYKPSKCNLAEASAVLGISPSEDEEAASDDVEESASPDDGKKKTKKLRSFKNAPLPHVLQNRTQVGDSARAIWAAQQQFHGKNILTDDLGRRIIEIIEEQTIKDGILGFCRYVEVTNERRTRSAHPDADKLRRRMMLRNVNWQDRDNGILTWLTQDTVRYNNLWSALECGDVKKEKLYELLELPDKFIINISKESGTKSLKGDSMLPVFKHVEHRVWWSRRDQNEKIKIFGALQPRSFGERKSNLRALYPSLADDEIAAIANSRSPQTTSAYGMTATQRLLASYEADWSIPLHKAALESGLIHIDEERPGYDMLLDYREILYPFINNRNPDAILSSSHTKSADRGVKRRDLKDRLRKRRDERLGRSASPQVHAVLRAQQQAVNAEILKYGKPSSIVVESTRDLEDLTKKKDNIIQQQKNEAARAELAKQFRARFGISLPEASRKKVSLMLHVQRILGDKTAALNSLLCPYCAKSLGDKLMIIKSPDIEMEHVIPRNVGFNNSLRNQVFAHHQCNGLKDNRAPEQFLSESELARGREIVLIQYGFNTAKLFQIGALEKAERFEGDWPARALVETSLITKMIGAYFRSLYPGETGSGCVRFASGKYTAYVRDSLRLNALIGAKDPKHKDRSLFLHHALDAAILGMLTPDYLWRLKGNMERKEPAPAFSEAQMSALVAALQRADVSLTSINQRMYKGGSQGPFFKQSRMSPNTEDGKTLRKDWIKAIRETDNPDDFRTRLGKCAEGKLRLASQVAFGKAKAAMAQDESLTWGVAWSHACEEQSVKCVYRYVKAVKPQKKKTKPEGEASAPVDAEEVQIPITDDETEAGKTRKPVIARKTNSERLSRHRQQHDDGFGGKREQTFLTESAGYSYLDVYLLDDHERADKSQKYYLDFVNLEDAFHRSQRPQDVAHVRTTTAPDGKSAQFLRRIRVGDRLVEKDTVDKTTGGRIAGERYYIKSLNRARGAVDVASRLKAPDKQKPEERYNFVSIGTLLKKYDFV